MKNGKRKQIKTTTSLPDRNEARARIEVRAYMLWEADGRGEGNALGYWLQAEQEILRGSDIPA